VLEPSTTTTSSNSQNILAAGNKSLHKIPSAKQPTKRKRSADYFEDEGIDDLALSLAIEDAEFADIDEVSVDRAVGARIHPSSGKVGAPTLASHPPKDQTWQPVKLENGKWACNHRCTDKRKCKHLCCKHGVEKPPKPPKEADAPPGTQSITAMKGFKKLKLQGIQSQEESNDKESQALSRKSFSNEPNRKHSNNSSQYGDGSILFDDDALDITKSSNATPVHINPFKDITNKSQSMFLTDSSSPDKPSLSTRHGCPVGEHSMKRQIHVSHNEPSHSSMSQNNKQRTVQSPQRETRINTLQELERIAPSFIQVEPVFSDFDGLGIEDDDLNHLEDNQQYTSVFDDPDIEEAMLDQRHFDSYMPHSGSVFDNLNPQFHETMNEVHFDGQIPEPLNISERRLTAEEEDLGGAEQSTGTSKHHAAKDVGVLSVEYSVEKQESSNVFGSEAWLLKEFGQYVNFI